MLIHRATAVEARQYGKLDVARECFKELVRIDPRDGQSWSELGEVYRTEQRPSDAITCFLKLVELFPNHAMAHAQLASAYRDSGSMNASPPT